MGLPQEPQEHHILYTCKGKDMPKKNRKLQYNTVVTSRVKLTTIAQLAEHYYKNRRSIRSISELIREAIQDFVFLLNNSANELELKDNEVAREILDKLNLLYDSDEKTSIFDQPNIRERVTKHIQENFLQHPVNIHPSVPKDIFETVLRDVEEKRERREQEARQNIPVVRPTPERIAEALKGLNNSSSQGQDRKRPIQEQIDQNPHHPSWKIMLEKFPDSEGAVYWREKYEQKENDKRNENQARNRNKTS